MLQRVKLEFKQGESLLKFGFLKAAGQVFGMAAPLVIAKYFSPELFGSYSLAKMVVFFFLSLLISSFQSPFIVFANQEMVQTGKINKSFSVQCACFFVGVIVFLILGAVFNKAITGFAKITSVNLFFMSLAFVGIALKMFLDNLFMAIDQRLKNSLVELVFGGLVITMVAALYLTHDLTLNAVFLVYFISGVIVSLLFATENSLLLSKAIRLINNRSNNSSVKGIISPPSSIRLSMP